MSSDALTPFEVLQVSVRDGRERIVEAADERSLVIDADAVQAASAVLTNPRRRIDAELAWYPGVAPKKAERAAAAGSVAAVLPMSLTGLPLANALIRTAPASAGNGDLARLIQELCPAVEGVTVETVLRDINEDREVAGFPRFSSADAAKQALEERLRAIRGELISALEAAPTDRLVESMGEATEHFIAEQSYPPFMHEIVQDYALRCEPFLERQRQDADRLVERAKEIAGSRPDALGPLLDALSSLLATWEQVTRPIQVSATLQGRTHEPSENLAFAVRGLSIDFYNDHQLVDECRRVADMVSANFSALPRIADKLAEDAQTLDGLVQELQQRDRQMAYAADIGTFFKSRLAITSTAVTWQDVVTPIASIRHASWGGINRSVNGVPTGTDYLIAWQGDGPATTTIELRNGTIYQETISRLWQLLAPSLIERITTQLGSGHEMRFGPAVVRDATVVLTRKKLFGDEAVEVPWGECTVHNANGCFVIQAKGDQKVSAMLSFRDVDDVHFLETIVRTAFKNGRSLLSEAFL